MMIVKNEEGLSSKGYILLTFAVFFMVLGAYYFSDELGIKRYLQYIVVAGFVLYFLVFFYYRKSVLQNSKRENMNTKSKQPWEKE